MVNPKEMKVRKRNVKSKYMPKNEDDYQDPTEARSKCSLLRILGYFVFSIFLLVVFVASLFCYTWYISPITPIDINLPKLPEYDGALSINEAMQIGYRIMEGFGYGPESTVYDKNGNLYTGYADGRIVKIEPDSNGKIGEGKATVIASGPLEDVASITPSLKNGRPLGLHLRENLNFLYVMDAHYGLYILDLKSFKRRLLIAHDDIEPPMKFPNHLALTKSGDAIYFTDSSSKYSLENLGLEAMEGSCNGRLFKYDLLNEELDILASDLCMANGLHLITNDTVVALSESTAYRIKYIDIKSKKVLRHTYLPAMPDNITPSGNSGNFWVGCCIRPSKMFNFIMSSFFLRRVLGATNTRMIYRFAQLNFGLAVKLNEAGEILSSIHDYTGNIARTVSEVTETSNGDLILSSFSAPFLVKIPMA